MFGPDAYAWIKALHVIAVMSWMAGMLYLPRLFIYHLETDIGAADSERFKLMERKLIRIIINPAMVLSWIFGGMLVTYHLEGFSGAHWLHVKLLLVTILSGIHGQFSVWRRRFERDERTVTGRTLRIWNEFPTLIMIGAVIMVIVKPF